MSERMLTKYQVARKDEVIASGRKIVKVKGQEIGIFHVDGEFYAWRNVCPHYAAPVCEGVVCGTRLPSKVYEYEYGLDQQILRCPWHGWEFDLKTGKHLADENVKLRGVGLETDEKYIYILGS